MPRIIDIDVLSPSSLRRGLQQMREYRQRLEERQQRFLSRLAEEGVEVARARFNAALLDYDGDKTPIVVEIRNSGTTAEIIASGRTVAFLEFGAGVAHPEHSTGLFQHGTYGQGKGQQQIWGFYQDGDKDQLVLTSGNDPAEAMTGALQRAAEICADVAREVFGSD